MKVQCTQCGSQVEFADIQPEIVNTPTLSIIVIEHRKPGFCLACKASVALRLADVKVMMAAAPVAPTPQRSSLIIAPGSALPKVRG